MDAVLVADAEVNEYRTFIRKGMFGSLLGEKGKYTDLIEALWFHLGESSEKITENYHVFLPSYIWRIVSAGRRKKAEFPDVGHFTCSIGLAELRPGDTPGSAFERADKALYRAKEAGRNRIVTAD